MTDDYKDIINLDRISKSRKPMDRINRAAQFAPFAALAGFEEEIYEAGRLTEEEMDLAEDQKEDINRKLIELRENLEERPEIKLVFFKKDQKKSGGAYIKVQGRLEDISRDRGIIVLEDGSKISIKDLIKIEIL